MRTYTLPAWRLSRAAAPSGGRWSGAALLPVGYAATWVVAERRPDTSLPGLVAVTIAVAVAHRVVPSLVELLVGAGGLVTSMFTATEQPGCGDVLGGAGSGVVLAFGGMVSVSAFVQLLGSGRAREMARHLLVGTAALGLGLLVVSPLAGGVVSPGDDLTLTIVLAGALLVTTLVGARSRVGLPLLGAGLAVALGAQALSGDPCALRPALALVGMATFVAAGVVLSAPAPTGRRP